ncbi:MAG: UDP-N-acetylmuramoyl-tripeptide--D-alanyl-D-alanine ligase [Gaiellaceae bacterium MAG52_C11]|nr:UDP-N-acetylmuramoyl-tripeptide--D-alanyl-D-alanine ligase [Candidatus Gaiellasilicea maunaloa]
MIRLSLAELHALELGQLEGEGEVSGLTIDSRTASPGDLFVAVQRGRAFVADARERGAATLIPHDEHAALAAIGGVLRSRSRARVVGITGSTGKTSTKDILAALCAPVARTVATRASENAELGVPLTLGRLEPNTELCLVELGMRGFGQIAELCAIARPDVAVITAIGPVHLELVGSIDGVARSKAELVAALPADGIAVVPQSAELEPYLRADVEVRRVEKVDVELRQDGAHVAFHGGRIRFPLRSRHQAQNALTALIAYEALGLPLERLQEGADGVELSRWRGEELPLPGGGIAINDAYNANPTSLRAALEHLAGLDAPRKLAVLGGMAELGEHAPRYHRELGELAGELGVEVVAVGELARGYGAATWVADAPAAVAVVRECLRPGDAVLVKASRALALEGVAPALANGPS